MDLSTIIGLAVTNTFQGIFFVVGFYIVGRLIAKQIKSEVPIWIKSITEELRKQHQIENALRFRNN